MKSLSLLVLFCLCMGCEECSFCTGEAVTYANGIELDREELPSVQYCDELLEELKANPVDTSFTVIDSIGEVMIVTTNSCF